MFKSTNIMRYVDQIRGLLQIKVKALNEGIVSSRNYSRYISGEYDLPFSVLEKYLKRMGLSIEDFFIYVYYEQKAEYQPHMDFIEAVKKREIDLAFHIYRRMNKVISSEVSKLLLPIRYYELLYLNKQILKQEFIDFLKSMANYDKLLRSETVTREEMEVLFICLAYCSDKDKTNIIQFMQSVIKEQRYVISLNFKHARQQLAMSVLKYFVDNKLFSPNHQLVIRDMINYLLELSEHFNMNDVLSDLLQCIMTFAEVIDDTEKYKLAAFYLISHKFTVEPVFEDVIKQYPQAYEVYASMIQQKTYLKTSFYHDLRFANEH